MPSVKPEALKQVFTDLQGTDIPDLNSTVLDEIIHGGPVWDAIRDAHSQNCDNPTLTKLANLHALFDVARRESRLAPNQLQAMATLGLPLFEDHTVEKYGIAPKTLQQLIEGHQSGRGGSALARFLAGGDEAFVPRLVLNSEPGPSTLRFASGENRGAPVLSEKSFVQIYEGAMGIKGVLGATRIDSGPLVDRAIGAAMQGIRQTFEQVTELSARSVAQLRGALGTDKFLETQKETHSAVTEQEGTKSTSSSFKGSSHEIIAPARSGSMTIRATTPPIHASETRAAAYAGGERGHSSAEYGAGYARAEVCGGEGVNVAAVSCAEVSIGAGEISVTFSIGK